MSRPARERLGDIEAACEAIKQYLTRHGADEDMVLDAIRVRLIEIGEAVKSRGEAAAAAYSGRDANSL